MSHVWMGDVTDMNESCDTPPTDCSPTTAALCLVCVTWLVHTCHMTIFLFFLFMRVTWFTHTCDMPLIHTCDMTHSYARDDQMFSCDNPHSYVWCASFIRVMCLIHTCDMSHAYLWYDWFIRGHDSFIRATLLIHTCDTPHANRVAKTHRIPYLYRSFSAKVTYI